MYRGVFLNLTRSETRRASLIRHLEEVGASSHYERFEAIDGRAAKERYATRLDSGNLGLWLSHEKLLDSMSNSLPEHLHIIEDDTILPKNAVRVFETALAWVDSQFCDWDLLFTDVFVQPYTAVFEQFEHAFKSVAHFRGFAVVDASKYDLACTSSMVINKSSISKYANLIAGGWAGEIALDMFIRDLLLNGHLKAYFTIPFLTSVSSDSIVSEIRGNADRSRRVCDILRSAFFVDADVPSLLTEIQEVTDAVSISPRVAVYLNVKKFMLSDQWEHF